MIETLGTATLVEASVTDEPVRITRITFENGELCKPRYPTLIDYGRAPQGVRFEPGFQILSPGRHQFLLQLEPGFEFTQELVSLNADSQILGLEVDWSVPFTCRLTLDGVAGKVASLRLPCRPSTSARIFSDEEYVYGGVYLALINREETLSASTQNVVSAPGDPEPHTIKLLGLDQHGRTVYDLFKHDALPGVPSNLGLEPTIGVYRTETVSFSLKIATIPDLEFEEVEDQQVKVRPFEPSVRPPELKNAGWADEGRRCDLLWEAASGSEGLVSTFYLDIWQPASSGDVRPGVRHSRKRRRVAQVDPTVIQPPSCFGGICI
jgi:hypothetical protein